MRDFFLSEIHSRAIGLFVAESGCLLCESRERVRIFSNRRGGNNGRTKISKRRFFNFHRTTKIDINTRDTIVNLRKLISILLLRVLTL